ncbi:RHS repeat domain-containing protein [Embleya scabrispora]|uniref:RHS repeat domain-containing protein n=1 Tax=Embleya scabrispora TaxID=159449 RepID=UPI001319E8C4|nr:RHS repeat-associated core domain-containing protein [Embleya scabrispora]MYS87828.1 RHS repeat protein [Streptomyces sp. SID5474]
MPKTPPVPVKPVRGSTPAGDTEKDFKASKVSWPKAEKTTVELLGRPTIARGRTGARDPGWVQAGSLPVRVGLLGDGMPKRPGLPSSVVVETMDRKATARAGVDGLLVEVRPPMGSGGLAAVELDYRGFAAAHGGNWGTRLTLVQMPECVLTTPDVPECQTRTPLPSRNDASKGTVSAEIDLGRDGARSQGLITEAVSPFSASGILLAAVAGPSGDKGDYKASSLAASGSWAAGASSGGFAWTYPIQTPSTLAGPQPVLSLAYSSQSVDGRTAVSNNQTGWVGDGWELANNFIERRYKGCADDMGSGSANTAKSGDLCWFTDNAVMSLNGTTTELVPDDEHPGTWKPAQDDGARVERLRDTVNGDDDGEHWKVTMNDGAQYFFGLNRLPGWTSGKPETASTFTVPVFGNNADEPCRKNGDYAGSFCQQAWRWNLDYVVDPRGNAMAYYYDQEKNFYGRNVNMTTGKATATEYVRGGWLNRIEYGLRSDNVFAPAPAQVKFDVSERCIPDSAAKITCDPSQLKIDPDPAKDTSKYWPDVPFDQNCETGKECKGNYSPTFWSRKRLTTITTRVLTGGTHQDVDSWVFGQKFTPTGDSATEFPLWLESIARTGKAGTGDPITLPPVTFNGIQKDNRVDGLNDGAPPFIRWRVNAVTTETGGTIAVVYTDKDCTKDNLPAPDTNGRRCYPVNWQKPSDTKPTLDWFHKYVVTQVREEDTTGGAPAKVTDYEYVGSPAWTKSTDEFTKPEFRTFSDYRGYETVRVRTGANADKRTLNENTYFRGLDGAQVLDSQNIPSDDHPAFQGMTRETRSYDYDGGPLLTASTTVPWHSPATATHKRAGLPDLRAFQATTGSEATRTLVDGGSWRRTAKTSGFDAYGLVTQADDAGDVDVTGDEQCTRYEYARNTGANMVSLVSRVEKVAVACDSMPTRPRDVISDERTRYDEGAVGATPVKGLVTGRETIKADGSGYDLTSRTSYDIYGRSLSSKDVFDAETTTAYTPTTGEIPTKIAVTDPKGFSTTTEFDPRRNAAPTATIDSNQKRSDRVYDTLGRLTAVWETGWSKADHADYPSAKFTYDLSNTAPTVVTTRVLMHNSQYKASYEILDSQLRPRQDQTPTIGGRLIRETFYDTRGWVSRVFNPYYTTGAPSPSLATGDPYAVPKSTWNEYDGQGRATAAINKYLGQEKTRVTTLYGGDRTTVLPPQGGTAQTTIVDARGNTTELRQYTNADRTTWHSTRYEYADRGRLTKVTDAGNNVWTNTYDVRGRKIAATDPDQGSSTRTYDAADRVTSITDARNVKLTIEYDALGRKTAVKNGDTVLTSWLYDTVMKGQQSSSTRYVDGQPYISAVTAYTDRYQPVTQTVTIPAREGRLAGTYTWKHYYNDRNGAPEMVDLPAVGGLPAETIRTTYDNALGLPVGTAGLVAYVQNTTYDNYASPIRIDSSLPGRKVYQTFGYDPHDRKILTSKVTRDTIPVDVTDTSYGYDPAGNVTKIVEKQGAAAGTPQTDTQCFGYDALRRMTDAWTALDNCGTAPGSSPTSVVGGPDAYWTSYVFDETGNRKTESHHGISGATDTTRTYQTSAHRLDGITTTGPAGPTAESYGYDAAGNTTRRTLPGNEQTLAWDLEGHLAKVTANGKESTYVYDPDGSRLLRREQDKTTLYLGEVELTWTKSDDKVLGTRHYTHGDKTIAERVAKPTGGTTLTFLAEDPHGTSHTAIDGATQQVTRRKTLPYGGPRGAQPQQGTGPGLWPDDKGFLGKTVDATGLLHIGAREYDPAVGRFISVDQILDLSSPEQIHGYAYAGNNPATNADPTGLRPDDHFDPDWNATHMAGTPGWGTPAGGTPAAGTPNVTPFPPPGSQNPTGEALPGGRAGARHNQAVRLVAGYLKSRFQKPGVIIMIEVPVPGGNYHGTKSADGKADIIMYEGNTLWVWEVKSSLTAEPEGASQIATYVRAFQAQEDTFGTAGKTVKPGFNIPFLATVDLEEPKAGPGKKKEFLIAQSTRTRRGSPYTGKEYEGVVGWWTNNTGGPSDPKLKEVPVRAPATFKVFDFVANNGENLAKAAVVTGLGYILWGAAAGGAAVTNPANG